MTHQYVEADLKMKARPLKTLQPPKVSSLRYRPQEPTAPVPARPVRDRGRQALLAFRPLNTRTPGFMRLSRIMPKSTVIFRFPRKAMRIDHIALWTNDLDRCKQFYASYFGARAGTGYVNTKKGFESYFLSFSDGARIEIMKTTTLNPVQSAPGAQRMGFTHIAISLGSEQLVDALTGRIKDDGYRVLDGPRRTGDGYYESVVLDPDGNRIEITA